ncbi:MAG: hypothetical protein KME07_05820 [Pegethrix bostrychoides GSE-TBD4-15B]|jgi:hypothetical protein|uniref:Uncharacterized protein n=1 Tax=Pegethrix bostrychoides GSE-TBD4-15B TaxID=2839662 RepID=A0A951P967_9CYAN|nr:hypothetical protein [Pegethrix bostrychoides GSE-TBD4-15B]
MSGRYHSKLFNFLSRQSLQLRHQSAKTWRQAKVAAVWGVQILLYPVYVTFQSARLLNRQLQQAVRQAVPRLRSAARVLSATPLLPADAPIQNLLQDLSQLAVHLPGEAPPELALALRDSAKQPHRTHAAELLVATAQLTASLQVRGLASMLGTGSLVLVTAGNQILDILTPVQQTHLTQRMAWELAGYWRQQRRFGQVARTHAQSHAQFHAQSLSTYLPPPKPQQNALPPIRAWRGLMAWMQRSAVAGAANLFQESRLSLPQAASSASLRSAQPTWEAAEAQFYGWLRETGRSANHLVLAGWQASKTALTQRSWPAGVQQFQRQLQLLPAARLPELQPQASAPADWLLALDRWVSQVPGLRAAPAATESLNAAELSSVRSNTALYVSWLKRSLHSLLPDLAEAAAWEVTDTAAMELSLKGQTQAKSDGFQAGAISEWDADYGMARPLQRRQPAGVPLTSLDTANSEEAAMVPQSWIETEVQLVEYVKHPLEQVLEWLDHGMLWVERRLDQIWQWLTRPIL